LLVTNQEPELKANGKVYKWKPEDRHLKQDQTKSMAIMPEMKGQSLGSRNKFMGTHKTFDNFNFKIRKQMAESRCPPHSKMLIGSRDVQPSDLMKQSLSRLLGKVN
jgi:hypothetical protein